jgi:hypothetical protein
MAGGTAYHGLPETYRFLAEACLGQGKIAEALEMAQTAVALAQKTEDQDHIGGAWRALGLVLSPLPDSITITDRTYDARACFAESLRVYAEMGAQAERARTLRAWARYEHAQGDHQAGRAMREEAQEIFSQLGMRSELERTVSGPE